MLTSCYLTKKFWSLSEIIEKLRLRNISISKRTVESDIEVMHYDERLGYNAPHCVQTGCREPIIMEKKDILLHGST